MAAGDGLISMKPTSITHSGTSASINSDGGVDFTAVTSLSLNGVFTGNYDNYLIVVRNVAGSAEPRIRFRLRVAGTDATGSNYTRQSFAVGGTGIAAARNSLDYGEIMETSATQRSGVNVHVYGPALAQPTAWRSITVSGASGAYIFDCAVTHSLSTAYDGFTMYPSASDLTGNIHVFGYEE